MNFVDKEGLYHDKPVGPDGRFSSQNGFIYTAYADALGFDVDITSVVDEFNECFFISIHGNFHFKRRPDIVNPPVSRDEVLGALALGLFHAKVLERSDWYYNGVKPKVSLKRQLKAMWYLKDKHSNTLWSEPVVDAWPLAFTLAPHDRYFAKKIYRMIPTPFEHFMFLIYAVHTLLQKNDEHGKVSAKNIAWLQLKMLGSKYLIKLTDQKKNFLKYFGPDHLFTQVKK